MRNIKFFALAVVSLILASCSKGDVELSKEAAESLQEVIKPQNTLTATIGEEAIVFKTVNASLHTMEGKDKIQINAAFDESGKYILVFYAELGVLENEIHNAICTYNKEDVYFSSKNQAAYINSNVTVNTTDTFTATFSGVLKTYDVSNEFSTELKTMQITSGTVEVHTIIDLR